MLIVLKVHPRAIMDVMGWSEASMLKRYVHVPDEIRESIAGDVGNLLWDYEGDGPAGALVPA